MDDDDFDDQNMVPKQWKGLLPGELLMKIEAALDELIVRGDVIRHGDVFYVNHQDVMNVLEEH